MVQFSSVAQSCPTLWELMVSGGKDGGKGWLGSVGWTCTRLYLKWRTTRTFCSTGNPAQGYVAAWMGGGLGESGYVCI